MDHERAPAARIAISSLIDLRKSVSSFFHFSGHEISSVEICGILVDVFEGISLRYLIDDGTGKIAVDVFTSKDHLVPLQIGNAVRAHGKLKEQDGVRFILGDFVKKISPQHLILAKLQTTYADLWLRTHAPEHHTPETEERATNSLVPEQNTHSPRSRVMHLVKVLDQGQGVDIDELLQQAGPQVTQDFLDDLVARGDLYEIRPGRMKLIE